MMDSYAFFYDLFHSLDLRQISIFLWKYLNSILKYLIDFQFLILCCQIIFCADWFGIWLNIPFAKTKDYDRV